MSMSVLAILSTATRAAMGLPLAEWAAGLPLGTVRSWAAGDFKKTRQGWVKLKSRAPEKRSAGADPVVGTSAIKRGTHVQRIEGDGSLSSSAQSHVLGVLGDIGLGSLLAKHPLGTVRFAKELPRYTDGGRRKPGPGPMGGYNAETRRLRIRTAGRKFGKKMVGGSTHSISQGATSDTESMQRTLVHEVAHHLQYIPARGVQRMIAKTYQDRPLPTFTTYAASRASEYFSEAVAAYVYEPEMLKSYDPAAFKLVEDVMKKHGVTLKPVKKSTTEGRSTGKPVGLPGYDERELARVGAEMERLQREGKWTKAAFEKLAAQALRATPEGEDDDMLEFLYNEAKEAWLE